jgi:hypothetical protein
MDEQKREVRLRRMASRQGYRLRKDRARSWSIDHHGGYMIVDPAHGTKVAGQRYEMTLREVEAWLTE